MTDSEINQRATSIESMERRLPHIESPYALRQEIARTRAHMGRTIDDLQKKLSPEHLKEQAQEALREATIGKVEEMANKAQKKAQSWRASVVETVKANPVPAAMVGAGLAWLLLSDSNGDEHRDYRSAYIDPAYRAFSPYEHYGPQGQPRSQMRETMEDVQERVGETAEAVRHQVGDAVSAVQEKAADVQHRAAEVKENVQRKAAELQENVQEYASDFQEEAQRRMTRMQYEAERRAQSTKRTVQHMWHENPLAVGLAAMAAGALFAMLIPSTEAENRWMGETRDHLVEQVQHTAEETYEKAQHVVGEAVETVEKESKGLAEHVKSVARDAQKAAVKEAEKQNITGGVTSKTTESNNS